MRKPSPGAWRHELAHCSVAVALLFSAGLADAAGLAGRPVASPASGAARPPPSMLAERSVAGSVLVLGDSLSAEYGVTRDHGWVALLQQRLAARRIDASVVNASVSGETTAGGRSRLAPLLLQYRPSLVILELGANDGLRGLPLEGTRVNLTQMSKAAKAAGAGVVIVGMQIPPNYGRRYSDEFAGLFSAVARTEGTALVPFMLKGVADVPDYPDRFQPDGIHPKESQHTLILDNIWPVLEPLLKAR